MTTYKDELFGVTKKERQQIRKSAAALAAKIRVMKRQGDWSIGEWRKVCRSTIRNHIKSLTRFFKGNRS